jgi:sialidase-1
MIYYIYQTMTKFISISLLLFSSFFVSNLNAEPANKENANSFQKNRLNANNYHQMRGGLQNCRLKFDREKKGRVAFLGGSITYNRGWRDSVCSYLEKRFPDTEFEFIAAGIPSMGSTPAAFRLERDVLANGGVDLLFEEAAVNDATNGRTSEEQIKAMEGIIRHTRKLNPAADIVIMHFVDPDKMKDYRKDREPAVIKNHNSVAEHYNIPVINLAKEVTDRIDNGEFTWKDDFKDLHPSPFGQGIYANSMIQFLDSAFAGHLDDNDKISTHILPTKLNNSCYDRGLLIDISSVKPPEGWEIDRLWKPKDRTGTRRNYTKAPMLICEKPGFSLKKKFNGNAVGIAVAAGQDAGIIEYRIDNNAWQKLNLFTRWSKQLHLPWYYTLASGLTKNEHVLEIRVAKTKDKRSRGNACRIRYFFVNK